MTNNIEDSGVILEACVETYKQAHNAQEQGAQQIELCGALHLDGLTPEYALIKECNEKLQLRTKVMIRPRGGDFEYNITEIEQMKADIAICKEMNVHGVVFGCLKGTEINLDLTKELAQFAQPLEVTFHKAIDYTSDLLKATKQLLSIHPLVDSILTSGGAQTAAEGASVLQELINLVNGKISIIPAGKITNQNIVDLHELLQAKSYHGKKIVGELS